jgi:hypothetical protein
MASGHRREVNHSRPLSVIPDESVRRSDDPNTSAGLPRRPLGFCTRSRREYDRAVRRSLAVVAAVAVAGCSQGQSEYPAQCSNGPDAVRAALAKAPGGDVAIDGVKLSDCLVPSADAGPLESFGGSVIAVSIVLVDRTRAGDERAATQLGYLRGALRRGADPGLHDELLRRFDQELLRVDTHTPAFRRGEAAGRERG